MRKFSFNLESLLLLRERDEQSARIALAQANARVAEFGKLIEEIDLTIQGAYSSWNGESGRRFSTTEWQGLSNQVSELKFQSIQAREKLKETEGHRAQAMKALQDALLKRQVVSNLKEKRMQEYTAEMHKQEAKEIDDVFNARRSAI